MFYTAIKMARHNGDVAPIPIEIFDDPLETAAVHLGGMTVRGLHEVSIRRVPLPAEVRHVQLEIEQLAQPPGYTVDSKTGDVSPGPLTP